MNVSLFAKPVPFSFFFFSKWSKRFFLLRSLVDRCQIMTHTCKKKDDKFVWKPFESPLSICSKAVQFMEDLALITA